ncbi:hypothetical protein QQ045_012470 [Rhodiola kirilowii]
MTRLCHLIRFQYLSRRKLRRLLIYPEFKSGSIYKLVLDSYIVSYMTTRTYAMIPVEVRSFELSEPRCEVYLKLKRDECAKLFPDGKVYSKTFHLNGRTFTLSLACNMNQQNVSHCFGLFLLMHAKRTEICLIQFKFSVIAKPTEDFEDRFKGTCSLTTNKFYGVCNLVNLPWTEFIAVDSKYFVADILRLKVELIVKKDPATYLFYMVLY